jgi:SAM-dependent methyltransferase
MTEGHCAACGAGGLAPHLSVAGEVGETGLIPTTDRYGTALADIVRCQACGHMQLERFPDEAELDEAYGEAESTDYIDEEAGQRATARGLLDRIERQVAPGSLLDLGCWVGFFSAEATARGWRVIGVEPSEFASAYARDRLGLDVRTAGLFEAELPRARFDAVFMGDVIEHLPDADQALAEVGGLLAPGGVLALALPNAGSRLARAMGSRWWSVIPTHVHYFTRTSIRVLLERNGYRLVALRTAPKTFTVAYYLERLAGYSPALARAVVALAQRLGVADRLWAPDFRDRMLVIARYS